MHTGCEVVPSTATKIFLDQKKELGELDKNMNSLFIPTPLPNSFCYLPPPPLIMNPCLFGSILLVFE